MSRPGTPLVGNAYTQSIPQVPATWDAAIARFEHSPHAAAIFPTELIRYLVLTKRQEWRAMADLSERAQQEIYLDSV